MRSSWLMCGWCESSGMTHCSALSCRSSEPIAAALRTWKMSGSDASATGVWETRRWRQLRTRAMIRGLLLWLACQSAFATSGLWPSAAARLVSGASLMCFMATSALSMASLAGACLRRASLAMSMNSLSM